MLLLKAVEEGAKSMILTAQNRALATNLYTYRRAVASLEARATELARKNSDMYALLAGLQGGLAQVRVRACTRATTLSRPRRTLSLSRARAAPPAHALRRWKRH